MAEAKASRSFWAVLAIEGGSRLAKKASPSPAFNLLTPIHFTNATLAIFSLSPLLLE